jgi:uncharacterized coiled-coil protein SlyX
MFELYRKVNRSIEHPNGAKKVEKGENPFLERPCLICVSPQDTINRTIFGFTKHGARMARVRVRGNTEGRIPLDEIPVSFLSIKPSERGYEGDRITDFVNTYMRPLLVNEDGKAKTQEEIMKIIRNVNIISNCDGTKRAMRIIKGIEEELTELGFNPNEIDEIISQIALVSFQTERDLTACKATVVDFHNINDSKVIIHDGNISDEMLDRHAEKDTGESVARDGRRIEVLVSGKDTHGIKDYMEFGEATPVVVHTVISSILENAIDNSQGKGKPLSADDLFKKAERVYERIEAGEKKEELLEELDSSLSYGGGITRLTDRELRMLEEHDKSMIMYERKSREQEFDEAEVTRLEKIRKNVVYVSKDVCTEGTQLRIFEACGWSLNTGEREKITKTKPDKEIIEEQEGTIVEQRKTIEEQERTIAEQSQTIETQEEHVQKLQGMLKRTLDFATEVRNSVFGKIFFRKAIKELPSGNEEERE